MEMIYDSSSGHLCWLFLSWIILQWLFDQYETSHNQQKAESSGTIRRNYLDVDNSHATDIHALRSNSQATTVSSLSNNFQISPDQSRTNPQPWCRIPIMSLCTQAYSSLQLRNRIFEHDIRENVTHTYAHVTHLGWTSMFLLHQMGANLINKIH